MSNNFNIEAFDGLFSAILSLENIEECRHFFEDVCTVGELAAMSQRLEVARLLKSGANYIEISEKTGASTATISRVKKCLVFGGGGYNTVLEREDTEEV